MGGKLSLDSELKEKQVATGSNKSWSRVRASLDDIPYELILDILSRLPVKSVFRCRRVCKTWYNIFDDPYLANMHMLNYVGVEETHDLVVLDYPTLHYPRYKPNRTRLFSLKDDGNISRTSKHPIAELVNYARVNLSAINLGIIIFENEGQCFLLNLFRGEVLMLPPVNTPRLIGKFGFGFDSTTKEYKVVHVFKKCLWKDPPDYGAEVYTLGTKSWRQISSVFPYKMGYQMPISAYGDVHWMISSDVPAGSAESMIISFDFTKEEFKLTPHPDFCCKKYKYFFLVDLRGSLAILDLSPATHMEIWVLKDYARKEWAQEYEIRMAELRFEQFRYIRVVGAWEEGLLFETHTNSKFLYCNLRTGLPRYILCNAPTDAEYYPRIYSNRRSLVSLRNHGKLMKKEVGTGNCFDLTCHEFSSPNFRFIFSVLLIFLVTSFCVIFLISCFGPFIS